MGMEPARGMLMLVCVATRGEISTGAVYTQDDLTRVRRAKLYVYCPFCAHAAAYSTCNRPGQHAPNWSLISTLRFFGQSAVVRVQVWTPILGRSPERQNIQGSSTIFPWRHR